MNIQSLSFFVFICLFVVANPQQAIGSTLDSLTAKIVLEENGTLINIKGVFINQSMNDMDLSYQLVVQRIGNKGQSDTNQGNKFKAPKQQEVVLSETNLNLSVDDYLKISLEVRDGDKLIAQDSYTKGNLVTQLKKAKPQSQNNTKQKETKSEDLELDGFIINATRTKVGRDFYNYFYNSWSPPKGAKNYTITIKELPARGRITRLLVKINDKDVVQRFLQPRNDLIKATAEQSVRIIQQQLRNSEALNKQLINEDQKGSGIF